MAANGTGPGPQGRSSEPRESLGRRLERTKLTPLVVLLFFGLLAAMSAAAAGIGWVVHSLRHPGVATDRPAPHR